MKIQVCSPSTTEKEIKWVNKALTENAISSNGGKYVQKFEEEFAKKVGVKYAVAVNSGTSALMVALQAIGIKEGDEVIVPDFTMISTINAVKLIGGTPVIVDVNIYDGNMNVSLIEEKITPKTKAILPVHVFGQPAAMRELLDLADKYQLKVVEDAAECHGGLYRGRQVGSIGDVGCFSFYANKIITTGEGGMITTDNKEIAEEARLLRACYFYPKYHFWHRKPAYNMRMSSLCAAYGLGQMERWDELIQARIDHAKYYTKKLHGVGDLVLPTENEGNKCVFWMYLIGTRYRNELMDYLEKEGVETRTGFFSCHKQPPYKQEGRFYGSEHLEETTMYLPSSSGLTKPEMDYVITKIKAFFKRYKI